MIRLSILDQSLIGEGETAADTLQHTVKLAQMAEECGYHRFWVAEQNSIL